MTSPIKFREFCRDKYLGFLPSLTCVVSAPYKPQPRVLLSMAIHTESDQVADFISAKAASKSQMVDLEVGRRPADLAAPTVTLQYPQSLRTILLRVQLQPKLLPHGLFL